MTAPAANVSPYTSAAGAQGMSANHSYDTSTPWQGDGYSDSPIQAYASPPSVDADRLGLRAPVLAVPPPGNTEAWYARVNRDTAQRESVTDENSTGWTERKAGSGRGVVPRPKPGDTGEPRPTGSMSPNTYFFERPFDARMERQFNGVHFSMADHRRTFDIMGMAPVAHARNTFRIEPGPTDKDITEVPTDTNYAPQYASAPNVPVGGLERSWRL